MGNYEEGSVTTKDPENGFNEVVYRPKHSNDEKSDVKLTSDIEKQSDPFFLYIATITACLLIFVCGCSFSWTSPVFPKLRSNTTSPFDLPITSNQESWIAAITPLGAALGPLAAGQCADRIGRKKTLTVLAVPMLLGYAVLGFAKQVELYYVARFILGLGIGSVFGVLPMYIAEISENHNRGKFSCMAGILATLGLLYPSLAGPVLSVTSFNLSCAVPLIVFLFFFPTFMPDSPVHLCKVGNRKEAEQALIKLRNKNAKSVQKELDEMFKNAETDTDDAGGFGDLFRNRITRKAFFAAAGLVIFQQLSGVNAVMAFMQTIFESTGSTIPPEIAAIVVLIIQVIVAIITSSVVDKLGRKTLIYASLFGCGTSIILLGLYFFLREHSYNVSSIFWLPTLCIIIYIIAFNFGLGPIPWTVMAEVFPPNVRSVGASLGTATCFVTCFCVTLVFPILSEAVGMKETFWMFGGCCIAGLAFTALVVPETKGKSLLEIQEALGR